MAGRFWTTSELRVVRANMDRADHEIGEMLGRTSKSVEHMRLKIGARKRPPYARHHRGRDASLYAHAVLELVDRESHG